MVYVANVYFFFISNKFFQEKFKKSHIFISLLPKQGMFFAK